MYEGLDAQERNEIQTDEDKFVLGMTDLQRHKLAEEERKTVFPHTKGSFSRI